jgi:hypothetical protein
MELPKVQQERHIGVRYSSQIQRQGELTHSFFCVVTISCLTNFMRLAFSIQKERICSLLFVHLFRILSALLTL